MKKYLKVFAVCLFTVTMVACTETKYIIESAIIGHYWSGDVGMNTDDGAQLTSLFFFDQQGFGTETQYYQGTDRVYDQLHFLWEWEDKNDDFNSNLILNYGRLGISFMDNLNLIGSTLTGTYLLDKNSVGVPFIFTRR